jgi:Flp pilus assembly protein TadD/thiol-disulfide isomerase/thioredoxin
VSQSPTSADPQAENSTYFRNFDALGVLFKRGSSFSGRERNCVFLNTGGERFADGSAVSQIDFLDDGRGVGLTDWDQDGDLDLWLANRNAPRLRLIRNDVPTTNRHLSLQLIGTTCNRDAVGARVEVVLAEPGHRRLVETVRAGDGFLTQSTKMLCFGVGPARQIQQLRVRWPGDDTWEEFGTLATNARYRVVQGKGVAEPAPPPAGRTPLEASPPRLPVPSGEARVVLTARVASPVTGYVGFDGKRRPLRAAGGTGPVLLNFWASSCAPCLHELRDFAENHQALADAGVTIVPLCADQLLASGTADMTAAEALLERIELPSRGGLATAEDVAGLTHLQSWIFYKQQPPPLPCSFLLDAEHRLAVIYRGATTADQIVKDVRLLDATAETIAEQVFPATGRFAFPKPGIHPLALVRAHREGGYLADAKRELEETLAEARSSGVGRSDAERRFLVSVYAELASVENDIGNAAGAVAAWRAAVRLDPENTSLSAALAVALAHQGDLAESEERLRRIAESAPEDPDTWRALARARLKMRDVPQAIEHFSRALELAPNDLRTRTDLAIVYQLHGDSRAAAEQYEIVVASEPSWADAANNLAWIYATDADADLRDGARAIELAQRACRLSMNRVPTFLGTLSAAYAEAGQFDEAIRTIRQAVQVAQATGEDRLVADLQQRLRLHERKLPYRPSSKAP